MSDDNIKNAFNKFKNTLYTRSYTKEKLSDLANLIIKKNKTEEDIENLKKLNSYVKEMKHAIEDLGTKIAEINSSEEIAFNGIENYKKNEVHVRDIVFYMDQFIDSLFALMRTYEYSEERFTLKKSATYLKAIRDNFVKNAGEFKIRIMRQPADEGTFTIVINDAIDNFISEAYSLRIMVIGNKLQEAIENYDREHRNNKDRP